MLHGLLSSCSEWKLLPSWGVQASHCDGLPCPGAEVLEHTGSVVVAPGLYSTGLVVVVYGLSCFKACEIFLDQGWNSYLHIGKWILTH